MILRRTDLSRKNGWADEYGKIYLYYPINEVVTGRGVSVDVMEASIKAYINGINKYFND